MKGLFFVFAVIATSCYAAVVEKSFSDRVKDVWKTCKKDSMSQESYHDMTVGNKLAETTEEKCFRYCLEKELGHMDGNQVNSQAVMESNKKLFTNTERLEKFNGLWTTCITETGTKEDQCETAGALTNCLIQKFQSSNFYFPELLIKLSSSDMEEFVPI